MLDSGLCQCSIQSSRPEESIQKIVEFEYGYHIIQLIEKRGDRMNTRHILLKPHIPEEALAVRLCPFGFYCR